MATIARQSIVKDEVDYLVVAVDPVNFEKPYTEKLEGVSTVYKSTPLRSQWESTLDAWLP